MDITPTAEGTCLWLKDERQLNPHITEVVIRWLERGAARKGRHINVPSVLFSFEREPALQKTYLYAFADSFPDTAPDWLRTARIRQRITLVR